MDDKDLIKMLIADRDSWRKMAQDLMAKNNTIQYPWTLQTSTEPTLYKYPQTFPPDVTITGMDISSSGAHSPLKIV